MVRLHSVNPILARVGKVRRQTLRLKMKKQPRKRSKVGRAKRRKQYNKTFGSNETFKITSTQGLVNFEEIMKYLCELTY